MALRDWFRRNRGEARGATFTQATAQTFAEIVGLAINQTTVTHRSAMQVPAFSGAVNVISGEIATLPIHVYERQEDGGRNRVRSPLADILNKWPTDETTRFWWLKYKLERTLTNGRCVTNIQRNVAGRTAGLFAMPPSAVSVARKDGRLIYSYTENGRPIQYRAREVLDMWFGLRDDGVTAVDVVQDNKGTLALALASKAWANGIFEGGGVPPFVVHGNFQSGDAMGRASIDIEDAIKQAQAEGRQVVVLPDGLTLDALGLDLDKAKWEELQRLLIEEFARIFSLPPTFLQDLTNGTFSNTEQQDLHFVKHTLRRWIEQLEQEINLKLFRGTRLYAEFQVDALLRGDFKTRMEGYAKGVQSGVYMPSEAREKENLPKAEGSDQLFIQSATVPIGSQPTAPADDGTNQPGDDDDQIGEGEQ